MIRQFFKDIVADLTNAVARSELVAENARLRAKVKELESDDARQEHIWAKDVKDLADTKEQIRDLRAKLEAATRAAKDLDEKLHSRDLELAELSAELERRQPVDRSAAIEAVLAELEFMSRDEACEAVDAVLGAAKAEPEKLTTKEAVAHICRELQTDEGYRIAWVANIAMQFVDRFPRSGAGTPAIVTYEGLHKVANVAAEGFIALLCRDVQRESPAAEPPVFAPAPTGEAPSEELVERMETEMRKAYWEAPGGVKEGYQQEARRAYALIAADHAVLAKENARLARELKGYEEESTNLARQIVDAAKLMGLDATASIADVLYKYRDENADHAAAVKRVRELENIKAQLCDDSVRRLEQVTKLTAEVSRLQSELAAKNSTIASMRADNEARPNVIADIAEAVGAPEGRMSLAPDVVAWARKQKAEIERISAPCPVDGMPAREVFGAILDARAACDCSKDRFNECCYEKAAAKARALFGRPAR